MLIPLMPPITDALANDAAMDPRDRGGDGWLVPDRFGRAIHEVIADIASRHGRPTDRQIVDAVSRALSRRSTGGPALRRRLTSMATTYCARSLPPSAAQLLGAEVEVGNVRFDLLWTDGTHVWVDELKSVGCRLTEQLATQCDRQVDAGILRWGPRFRGVRVVWLQTPGRHLLVSRTSTVRA